MVVDSGKVKLFYVKEDSEASEASEASEEMTHLRK